MRPLRMSFVGALLTVVLTAGVVSPSIAADPPASEVDLLGAVAAAASVPVVIDSSPGGDGLYTVINEDGDVGVMDGGSLPDEAVIATPGGRGVNVGQTVTGQDVDEVEDRLAVFATSRVGQAESASFLVALQDIEALSGYTYSYTYVIWKNKKGSTKQARSYFSKLNKKMNKAFPLGGLPAKLKNGSTYKLKPGSNPVKVTGLGSDYFTVKSLPGHAEGANKSITFRIKYMSPSYRLSVTASGPAKEWQKNPIAGSANKLFAYTMWSNFACGIREHAVERPCF